MNSLLKCLLRKHANWNPWIYNRIGKFLCKRNKLQGLFIVALTIFIKQKCRCWRGGVLILPCHIIHCEDIKFFISRQKTILSPTLLPHSDRYKTLVIFWMLITVRKKHVWLKLRKMSLTVIAVKRTVQEQKQHSLVLFMRSDLKCELTTYIYVGVNYIQIFIYQSNVGRINDKVGKIFLVMYFVI